MADDRRHDEDHEQKRYPSSFREARERGGNATDDAHTLEDIKSDHSMDPQPVDLPAGTGSAVGKTVGAVAGAVVGGAVGIVAGPAGIVAGAAAGAAAGAGLGGGAGDWADQQDTEDLEDKRRKDGPADPIVG